jgi:GNAT superfamily N-acetyltransferase
MVNPSPTRIGHVEVHEVPGIIELFATAVYDGSRDEAEAHFFDHVGGDGETFLAWVGMTLAGYVTIRWESTFAEFRDRGIPIIHHLEVLDGFERQGIATRLMDAAEQLIATRSDTAGIMVGLFDAYGPAQRLYASRGYIPDGRGCCHLHRPLTLGETVTIDHDLLLWLTKDVSAR